MRCEVVAIGTELLLGTVVDSNSAWIGGRLALGGIDCLRSVRVGDNHDRMVACIRESLARADAVICCGGLGPTQDDVTREAIAEVMGVDLVRDDGVADVITEMFASRGRRMPDNNLRQADVPRGATVIAQTRGTAPGLICPVPRPDGSEQVVYAVPGVPHEMKDMVERVVVPDLRRRSGDTSTIVSRTLRTWGESESGLAERLDARMRALDESGSATIAFNASGIEGLKVRITAKGTDEASAWAAIDDEEWQAVTTSPTASSDAGADRAAESVVSCLVMVSMAVMVLLLAMGRRGGLGGDGQVATAPKKSFQVASCSGISAAPIVPK